MNTQENVLIQVTCNGELCGETRSYKNPIITVIRVDDALQSVTFRKEELGADDGSSFTHYNTVTFKDGQQFEIPNFFEWRQGVGPFRMERTHTGCKYTTFNGVEFNSMKEGIEYLINVVSVTDTFYIAELNDKPYSEDRYNMEGNILKSIGAEDKRILLR